MPFSYAASGASSIGSTIEGSSFSDLLTRVEIGHIHCACAIVGGGIGGLATFVFCQLRTRDWYAWFLVIQAVAYYGKLDIKQAYSAAPPRFPDAARGLRRSAAQHG